MCTEDTEADLDRAGMPVGRRSFAALAGAGALIAALPARALTGMPVKGLDVTIKTADGTADAYFVAPTSGKHPGVLIWPDIRGLRPAFRQMADRLAGEGYAVLCVNPFYRWQKSPVVDAANDFSDPAIREKLFGYLKQLNKQLAPKGNRSLMPRLTTSLSKCVCTGAALATRKYQRSARKGRNAISFAEKCRFSKPVN